MSGYVYRGTIRDAAPVLTLVPPKPKSGPKPKGFTTRYCGTHAGYKLHRKHGLEACVPCKAANAASTRKYYQKAPRSKEFDPSACGTLKGFHRHVRAGQEPCEPCRVAKNVYQNERRALRKAAA